MGGPPSLGVTVRHIPLKMYPTVRSLGGVDGGSRGDAWGKTPGGVLVFSRKAGACILMRSPSELGGHGVRAEDMDGGGIGIAAAGVKRFLVACWAEV